LYGVVYAIMGVLEFSNFEVHDISDYAIDESRRGGYRKVESVKDEDENNNYSKDDNENEKSLESMSEIVEEEDDSEKQHDKQSLVTTELP